MQQIVPLPCMHAAVMGMGSVEQATLGEEREAEERHHEEASRVGRSESLA